MAKASIAKTAPEATTQAPSAAVADAAAALATQPLSAPPDTAQDANITPSTDQDADAAQDEAPVTPPATPVAPPAAPQVKTAPVKAASSAKVIFITDENEATEYYHQGHLVRRVTHEGVLGYRVHLNVSVNNPGAAVLSTPEG